MLMITNCDRFGTRHSQRILCSRLAGVQNDLMPLLDEKLLPFFRSPSADPVTKYATYFILPNRTPEL